MMRRRRHSGFTLLELVLAMSLAALIAVPMYQSLRIAYKARDGADAALLPSRTIELAMEFLRMDIESAMNPSPNSVGYATSTTSTTTSTAAAASSSTSTSISLAGAFIGSSASDDRGHPAADLIFYTTSDGPAHPPGPDTANGDGEIKMVELTMLTLPGAGGHALVRRVTRNLLAPQQINPDDEVLCRYVSAFNLRYYDGSNWQESWDSTQQNNELPVAVEVTLALDPPMGENPNAPTQNYVRIFPVIASTLITDQNATTSTTTTGTTSSGTSGTSSKGKTP